MGALARMEGLVPRYCTVWEYSGAARGQRACAHATAAAMGRFPYQNIGIDAWSSMPIAVTPSLYVTDTLCVGHMYHIMALP